MKVVKYGIIGAGNMGAGHIGSFMNGKVKNAVVAAIADSNPDKLNAITVKYPALNAALYSSGDELIEKADVDAVIVAVPHYLHSEVKKSVTDKVLNTDGTYGQTK